MSGPHRSSALPLAAVLAAVLGWPLAVAVRTGSLSIPHNDAWSHSKIAQHFARTGSIDLVGWNRSALIGQIVPLGPLGASIVAQQLAVLLTAAIALVSAYFLVRRVAGPSPAATTPPAPPSRPRRRDGPR